MSNYQQRPFPDGSSGGAHRQGGAGYPGGGQTNPTWLGHVDPGDYRPAPSGPSGAVQPMIPPAVASRGRRSAGVMVLVLGGAALAFLSLFLVVPFLLASTGAAGFLIGFLASLVPLAVVLLTVFLIDRWEPEPKRLLVFAFTWGAAVSIAVTLLIQPLFAASREFSSDAEYFTFMATVQAPIVEEFAKSLGLLMLLLLARKHFDGPVDGVVFAFTIAGGFAFTENILYFGRAVADSSSPATDLASVFFLRGIMSPFAHAVFTATTGLIMGFAARKWHNGLSVAAFFVGLLPAMFLHNRWNSMGQDFLLQYLMFQVPMFVLVAVVVVLVRLAENRLTRQRLREYAAAGWFTPAEVDMLATGAGRRAALAWAAQSNRRPHMKAFIRAATQLAFARQRILAGRDVPGHQVDEQHALQEILALRATAGR
ncbi:PrsW family intramembrane metalloprotease [Pseudarthrobacter sp. J75]|uniref:PrsW family intramembrane metalloprotease n=1 Tax=unclassified Pseudarthrobacter TaxID=2647000 RepID=UPI002E806A40|nr:MULTISPECIES: PrsW family intramembrane metalloprotease [unclassified Pseudarthrobacter]MEE2523371.1 PrsW family intramembrane metalloprotease [Pseudarthrobacter sp. J47]MEE2529336.1 PrsW family intramembrane metalloprotease [Pseudarthrobacter sp. J75]